ncbi:hemicentin-1 isoform X1 [Colossoma macropomum]|uniref:hemicentin-1 isoform X1 n=1 Tax=Colossoma macropomum TaxID=42526 RepID=UPI001864F9E5|nr:hemicentin-1 isoform X1 [Colossoma macropomum]
MTKMTFTFNLLLVLLGLCSMWQRTDGQALGKPVIWGPSEGIVRTVEEFFCKVDEIPEDVSIVYQLFKEGDVRRLIGEYTSLSGEPGKFPVYVRSTFDGRYICKASGHNNAEVIPSYSDPLRFRVIEKIEGAHITLDPPSEEFWEEESVTLQCSVTRGTYVSYDWLLDKVAVQHHYNRSQNQLTIQSLSTSDSGRYSCVASNQFNGTLFSSSTSDGKNVNVKDGQTLGKPVIWGPSEGIVRTVVELFCKVDENPEDVSILYQLFKEGDVRRPPVEYTSLSGEPGKFSIYVRSDHDERYICKASGHNNTEVIPSQSDPLRFRVIEKIEGAHITLDPPSEEFWEEESVTLQCSVTKGTYVSYDWLLNNVPVRQHYNRSQNQLTIQSLSTSDSGRYSCVASNQFNGTLFSNSTSDGKNVNVKEKIEGAHITLDPPSEEFWEEESVTLQCSVTKGTYVSYDWLLNNVPVRQHYNRSQNQLTIQSLSTSDSGRYSCVASNQFNGTLFSNSTSDGKNVNVKEHVSEPKISFEVVKDGEGIFSAIVKCQSEKGTSPITFTLLRNNDSIAEEQDKDLQAKIVVPIQLDRNMGLVQCQASDRTRTVSSKPVNITVESVGGAVTMKVNRTVVNISEVWAVWLRCSVQRGTFPEYSWFLNNTRLEKQDLFLHQTNNAVFQVILVPETAGLYHCEAANAFDNTTRVLSQKWLINKEVMNRLPLSVTILVFTSFFLLIVAVTACCLYGVVLRKKKARIYRVVKEEFTEMSSIDDGLLSEDEDDELSVAVYEEDMDVVEASRIEDSDEGEDEESSIPDEESDEEKNLLDEETLEGAGTQETE